MRLVRQILSLLQGKGILCRVFLALQGLSVICSGDCMLLEHERFYGLGMDALACSGDRMQLAMPLMLWAGKRKRLACDKVCSPKCT